MERTTITLSIADINGLGIELNALNNEELSFKTKFRVNEIRKTVEDVLKPFLDLRESLIKELGEEENGTFGIKPFIGDPADKVKNPKLEEFKEKIKPVEDEMRELSFIPLKMELFEKLDTKVPYSLVFKVVEG